MSAYMAVYFLRRAFSKGLGRMQNGPSDPIYWLGRFFQRHDGEKKLGLIHTMMFIEQPEIIMPR